jgi:RNA polymerase sigma-70 factor (ECF subfamily)
MTDQERLAEEFEQHRPRLRAVAYRMLGSLSEADDAVQEAWLRVSRADADEVENLGAWLTTIVARVALNGLRARNTRHEQPFDPHLPDPIVERSPEATRQLASRARRRVRDTVPSPDVPLAEQWRVVDAFMAAARDGDFERLVAVLDPDVVLRADGGLSGLSHAARGAEAVAGQAAMWSRTVVSVRRALVNGAAGLVSMRDERPFSVGAFTVRGGRIVELDFLVDPERLARLDLRILDG